MSTIRSPFSIWLIKSNFSSILIVFHWFFTWIAPGDADLHFPLILVTKTNTLEGGTTSPMWLYHQCNQSTRVTDGMTVTSLHASLQHEASAAMDRLCQTAFNWKISRIVYAKSRQAEKWCKFSSHIRVKSRKKNLHKMRPACNEAQI